jgi:hypothetical protein
MERGGARCARRPLGAGLHTVVEVSHHSTVWALCGGCVQSAPPTVSVRAAHMLLKCWALASALLFSVGTTRSTCCPGIIRQLTLVNVALFKSNVIYIVDHFLQKTHSFVQLENSVQAGTTFLYIFSLAPSRGNSHTFWYFSIMLFVFKHFLGQSFTWSSYAICFFYRWD